MTTFTSHQLVLTAIGEDRSGIVSELTQLVSESNCNIIDSRIAILGNEFTFIMLLSGDMAAISRVEHTLPVKSVELGLMTMMKRTSSHTENEYGAGYTLKYSGLDTQGTLSRVTRFFAEQNMSICSLKSDTYEEQSEMHMSCLLEFNTPSELDFDKFKEKFEELSGISNVNYVFRRIR
ncbi:glycine cleavage system protein R [Pseudoalteromonas luteoviolacea]|uniref:Glycine cleavage system transcriptional repressor n=1 Tax=Pseudoalteromonas luteoviolacea NCIMB 1942 TaxID=1365253 RepID=A0A167CR11_9GAMM|nr:ACT domain-containing protein [Pseudoalteromonas luteoviolacea]KZN47960.1 transcriptional regulator [Pseudoalteromonas luteoviolacea NCIMB 1942]KZX00545.1 transcriptional regulator [Pseudoalteromonas luteoviolacea]